MRNYLRGKRMRYFWWRYVQKAVTVVSEGCGYMQYYTKKRMTRIRFLYVIHIVK